MSFDVARVRGLVPALGDGWVHLDATAGMQLPEQVVSAITTALRIPRSAPGGVLPASVQAEAAEQAARAAVGDLVGADPRGVVLGPGPSILMCRLADAMSASWMLGDEIVVSRLDHPATVPAWLRAAEHRGVAVRWAEIDIETGELPIWQFDALLDQSVRVVAVTGASAQLGTRPDVAAIAERTREIGAVLVVDLSAAAAFGPQDLDVLGADIVVLDAAAWGGPPVGALVFRNPALLDQLPPCSPDPTARGPARLELGPHCTATLAGLAASVDHLAGLDDTATGSRRTRLRTSLEALEEHQSGLVTELLDGLRGLEITVLGAPEHRVPMLSLTHAWIPASEAVKHLAGCGICAFADAGEQGVLAQMGTAEVGGVIRIGLAHYTTRTEIAMLISALADLN